MKMREEGVEKKEDITGEQMIYMYMQVWYSCV